MIIPLGIVLIGEIGGGAEEKASEYLRNNNSVSRYSCYNWTSLNISGIITLHLNRSAIIGTPLVCVYDTYNWDYDM